MKVKARDLQEGAPVCPSCGKSMGRLTTMRLAGQAVRAWQCACGESILNPEDAQKALAANKLKTGVQLKIGELNKAPYVRFTKEFSTLLRKGANAVASLVSPNEIRLKILKS